jgi:predicted dehydrogenase
MTKTTQTGRRTFLKGAITLSALAAQAQLARAAQEKQPVRIAVVGTGARGCDLIRALTTIEGAEIVGLCDDYPPHLENGIRFAGNDPPGFANFGEMLDRTKPQAVLVATPLALHAAMCLTALDAGCDVFCEKTMCHSADEARHVAARVAEKKAVFQVGLQRRANAIYRQGLAMVEAGMLGQITAIKAQWHRHNNWRRPVPVPRGHADYAQLERRLNWRLYWDDSQGLMAELASHQLDIATWYLKTMPHRVLGSAGIDYWRDGREVFDNVFAIYEYKVAPQLAETGINAGATGDGKPYTVRVTYSSIQSNQYEGASELILGTRGTLFLTQKKGLFYREAGVDDPGWAQDGRVAKDAALITAGKTLKMTNDPWAHRGSPFEIDAEGDDTRDELVEFLNCVRTRDVHTICDAATGLGNTQTVLAGNLAFKSGAAVEITAAGADASGL